MEKQFSHILVIMIVILFALSSCASMRYESFDTGVIDGEDPWTEKEINLKEDLWQGSKIVEDFDDGEIDSYFQDIINSSGNTIEDGILSVNRIDKDNVFEIYDSNGFKSITFCMKSKSGIYISSHTKRGSSFRYDIEPWITFNSGGTFIDLWNGKTQSQIQLYRSESSLLNKWVVVELRKNEDKLEFYVNGKKKTSANIDGRIFPGVTFHLTGDSDKAEIDYIIVK